MTLHGPTHIFVWYRIEGDGDVLRRNMTALLRAVETATGIAGRVLARREDPSTWMEIYEHVVDPAAFERILASLAERHGVAGFARDGRQVERFAALDDVLSPSARRSAN